MNNVFDIILRVVGFVALIVFSSDFIEYCNDNGRIPACLYAEIKTIQQLDRD